MCSGRAEGTRASHRERQPESIKEGGHCWEGESGSETDWVFSANEKEVPCAKSSCDRGARGRGGIGQREESEALTSLSLEAHKFPISLEALLCEVGFLPEGSV